MSRAGSPPAHYGPPPAGYGGGMGGMPMYAPRGPGLMGTMAAAAGGSILGNAMARQMFDSPQPTSEKGVKEMKEVMDQSPCAVQFDMYAKCMEHNKDDAAQCQWAWDYVSQCRTNATQQLQQQQKTL
jgi:hypothetical protein